MMLSTGFLIILLLLSRTVLCESSASNECLDRFMDISLLEHRAGSIGTGRIGECMDDGTIRIVASIVFDCSTSINSVILGIYVGGDRDSFPSFQIWRPIGGNGYMLEDERLIVYTPANVSRTGVYEYPLVPPIDVLAGDLIALSQQTHTTIRFYYIDNIAFDSYEFDDNVAATTVTLSPDDVINNQLLLVYPMTAQPNCVNSPFSAQDIIDQSLLITESRTRDSRQFIYPDMKFRCNGTINKWIFGGLAMSGNNQPELQVWRRQTGTEDTYTRHAFTPVTTGGKTAIGSNVYEYILDTPVEFMEEDVFGMFQPDTSNFDLYAQRESGPENYRVDSNVDNPSNNLVLSQLQLENGNDYPLVSLDISISTQEIRTSTTSILTTIVTEITTTATATVITVTINATRLTGSQPAVTSSQPTVVIMTTSTTASLSVSTLQETTTVATVATDTPQPSVESPSSSSSSSASMTVTMTTIVIISSSMSSSTTTSGFVSPSCPVSNGLSSSAAAGITLAITVPVTAIISIIITIIIMYLVYGKHNKQSYTTTGPPEEYRNNATALEMNTNAAYGQIQYNPVLEMNTNAAYGQIQYKLDEPTYY